MEKVINGVSCRVVEKEWDVYFDMALTMFEEIVKNNQAGKPSVFIVPVGPTDQYPILAKLINSQRVSLKNVHFFNMDEYLVSPTQWISEDDPMSFHGRMKREFYDRVDESLVMPESQRRFPEPGHEKERIQILRIDDLLRLLAGHGVRERPPDGLPLQRRPATDGPLSITPPHDRHDRRERSARQGRTIIASPKTSRIRFSPNTLSRYRSMSHCKRRNRKQSV